MTDHKMKRGPLYDSEGTRVVSLGGGDDEQVDEEGEEEADEAGSEDRPDAGSA